MLFAIFSEPTRSSKLKIYQVVPPVKTSSSGCFASYWIINFKTCNKPQEQANKHTNKQFPLILSNTFTLTWKYFTLQFNTPVCFHGENWKSLFLNLDLCFASLRRRSPDMLLSDVSLCVIQLARIEYELNRQTTSSASLVVVVMETCCHSSLLTITARIIINNASLYCRWR